MQPLLSIIIPVFNRQKQFEHLCKSLHHSICLADSHSEVEVIVVDDGSAVPVYLPELMINASLIRCDLNKGAPLARKKGYQYSRGAFIHFHDSDDAFHEMWIDAILNVLHQEPKTDLLITGRETVGEHNEHKFVYQKFLNDNVGRLKRIKKRLVYRNCLGPLGGVTFSRHVLEKVSFKSLASCQDWQMYLESIGQVKKIISRPDITFYFSLSGDDRISRNPKKKLFGHLQLSHSTIPLSIFRKNIRLFYLMTWREYFSEIKTGGMRPFYKKRRWRLWTCYLVISLYWRMR